MPKGQCNTASPPFKRYGHWVSAERPKTHCRIAPSSVTATAVLPKGQVHRAVTHLFKGSLNRGPFSLEVSVKQAVVMASGPSMCVEDAERVREWQSAYPGNRASIVVNSTVGYGSFRVVPFKYHAC